MSHCMNDAERSASFNILVQVQIAELHIDKHIGLAWKLANIEDLDDILVTAIAKLADRPYFILHGRRIEVEQVQ